MRLLVISLFLLLAGCTIPITKNDIFVTGANYNLSDIKTTINQSTQVNIPSKTGFLDALIFKQKKTKITIIIAHGSSGNISSPIWLQLADLLASQNANIILFDYSGYGKSTGTPSINQLSSDLETVINYAKNDRNLGQNIILYGSSIGTVPALEVAAKGFDISGIILEAPISSTKEFIATRKNKIIGANFFEISLEDGIEFNSIINAKKITIPTLILHGTKDESVPIELGKEIYSIIPSNKKVFVEFLQGGHAGLYKIDSVKFINAVNNLLNQTK